MNKTALIFGISGQDGAYLSKLLIDKGYIVHGTSRDAEMNNFSSLVKLEIKNLINFHSVSLTDFQSVLRVIEKVAPNEIYNLSGQSSVGLSFEQPLETLESIAIATINILESMRFLGGGFHFYNASSSESFGNKGDYAANEETPFNPKSPYGVAKAAAFWQITNYRESYDLYACSGIMFNHESYLRPKRFVTRKICNAAARIALGSSEILKLGDISIKRDWGWAPEYVNAMWMMLQQEKAEDFVIATGYLSTLREFISYAFSALDLNWEKYVTSIPELYRASEIRSIYGSPKKANTKLNWRAERNMPEVAKLMSLHEFELLKNK
tara:strand:+ start:4740 stop:5711 length:972 start_codon:yes stop_codon:yes gene_type:complete